jgi:hypothetical protein
VWTIQDALGGAKTVPGRERDAYVKVASNWLLLTGEAVHAEIADGELVSSKEWRRWRDRVYEVADGKWNKKPCTFDEDAVRLAGRASVAMEAIERRKTG